MYQYPKNILSTQALIQKLINAGMTINSQAEAESALNTIGYYRLKGYFFNLYDKSTQRYINGTDFSNILKLYYFDMELSHLLFGFISQIEVALRARLVNALLIHNDALILNDPSVFDDKELYWKNQGTIASEIARSNDVFIEHNYYKHDGAIPLWAAVEIMSFGTLSKVIKTLKTGTGSSFAILVQHYQYQSAKGNMVIPSKDAFTSWTQSISIMRNICAHNSRIYNRTISTRPELIAADVINPRPQFNGLYQIMLAMKYLRPSDDVWKTFITDFSKLLKKYDGVFSLQALNFPNDWGCHFLV